jgi:hypothetical protein
VDHDDEVQARERDAGGGEQVHGAGDALEAGLDLVGSGPAGDIENHLVVGVLVGLEGRVGQRHDRTELLDRRVIQSDAARARRSTAPRRRSAPRGNAAINLCMPPFQVKKIGCMANAARAQDDKRARPPALEGYAFLPSSPRCCARGRLNGVDNAEP